MRPRKDKRGVDLISDVLPFGRLWYWDPNAVSHAISYAKSRTRSHDAVIRVYDAAGTAKIKAATSHLKGVKIAIMGCIVNGPGEMADADFGYVGGAPGKVDLLRRQNCS